jgi:phosphopantothenoylcysteine decarboxylase/phosphopantothenate--cysteine ligase
MGFALASEAAALGADVTVVAANVTLDRDPRVRYLDVETAQQLQEACATAFADSDVLLMAAAVVDFRPAAPFDGKLKKGAGSELQLELDRTPDILAGLAATRRPGQTIVGFAAEHGDGEGAVALGRGKLIRKRLDAVVVNDISRTDIGFDATDNEVTIVTADDELHVALASKAAVARAVLDTVMRLRAGPLRAPETTTGPAA